MLRGKPNFGSSYYVDHPVAPHDSTLAMLNFDMVGRLSGDTLVVGGTGSAEELEAALDRHSRRYGLAIGKQAFYRQVDLDTAGAYDFATDVMAATSQSDDAKENVRAFLEKRAPDFGSKAD